MDKITNYISYTDEAYKRVELYKQLPLKTPFSVEFCPTNLCNLQCGFCTRISEDSKYNFARKRNAYMQFELLKKSVDDMKVLDEKIKTIHFTGWGEPLLNKEIVEMLSYTVESDVACKVDITTNGVLLNKGLIDKLTLTGIHLIKISLYGLCDEDYEKNCGVKIDFNKLVENIKYLYENRKNIKIYIKIFDYMIDTEERKKRFYQIFNPISTILDTERIFPLGDGIDYDLVTNKKNEFDIDFGEVKYSEICSFPFYFIRINTDGAIAPCANVAFNENFGNIKENSFYELWNSRKYNDLRKKVLNGVSTTSGICKECRKYIYSMTKEDLLDNHVEELKKIFI